MCGEDSGSQKAGVIELRTQIVWMVDLEKRSCSRRSSIDDADGKRRLYRQYRKHFAERQMARSVMIPDSQRARGLA